MSTDSRHCARNAFPSAPKAAVTVAEMASLCGLSRTRFYELLSDGVFPHPQRKNDTARPYYDREGQEACLRVKATNQGINGKLVLFYSRRHVESHPKVRAASRKLSAVTPQQTSSDGPLASLAEGLRLLGLEDAAPEAIRSAVTACFPNGLDGVDDGVALTAVFRHLKRRNTGENVG